jgi:hypothetical protein
MRLKITTDDIIIWTDTFHLVVDNYLLLYVTKEKSHIWYVLMEQNFNVHSKDYHFNLCAVLKIHQSNITSHFIKVEIIFEKMSKNNPMVQILFKCEDYLHHTKHYQYQII